MVRTLLSAIAVAIVVLCAPVIGASSASTAAGADGETSAPLVATGTSRTASGEPAAGHHVVLFKWPSETVMASLQEGDGFTIEPIAETTSASDGGFELRYQPPWRPLSAPDTILDLEVYDLTDSSVRPVSFSRILTGGGTTAHLTAPSSEPSGPVEIDLVAGSSAATGGAPTGPGTEPVQKYCESTLVKDYGLASAVVGQHYSTTSGVTADFGYTQGADSTISVAYSASGAVGSYSHSGTVTRSSSATIDYAPIKGAYSVYRRTNFDIAKYKVKCVYGMVGSVSEHYEVKPRTWAGGASTQYVGPITATHCVTYEPSSRFTLTSTKAITWSDGVDASKYIGLDLSIRTGYSTEAKLVYTFQYRHHLCGQADYPIDQAYQIEAKP